MIDWNIKILFFRLWVKLLAWGDYSRERYAVQLMCSVPANDYTDWLFGFSIDGDVFGVFVPRRYTLSVGFVRLWQIPLPLWTAFNLKWLFRRKPKGRTLDDMARPRYIFDQLKTSYELTDKGRRVAEGLDV